MIKMYGKSAMSKAALAFVWALLAVSAHGAEENASLEKEKGQFWLTTGFHSYHFERAPNYNEQNTGLGFEYHFNKTAAVAIGHYDNSVRRSSTYLHFVYTPLGFGPVNFGGAIGLLNGYPMLRNGRFAPVVLPVVRTSFKLFNHDVGVNFAYIPTISNRVDGAVAVQFRLRLI
jgi:hypothetical protein